MGNNQISGGCYEAAVEHYTGAGGWTGGYYGSGDDDEKDLSLKTVKEYADSRNALTKNKLVDDIVGVLKGLGLDAEASTREEKLNKILALVPNSRKTTKKFRDDPNTHKNICKKLAQLINEKYGKDLINPNADPEMVCQQVSEIAESLRGGMHSELLSVYTSVERVLKNIELLREELKEVHAPIIKGIDKHAKPELRAHVAKYEDLFNDVLNEFTRQMF